MKKQLRSLLETLNQVLIGAVSDFKLLAKKEEVTKRLITCSECKELDKNLCCKICGCRVAYKARLKHTKCPKNKW